MAPELRSAAKRGTTSRRRFLQYLAMLGVGARVLLRPGSARAAADAAAGGIALPPMAYRRLGRTGFDASRLVFGCGASLMFRRKDDLLQAGFDAGINVFDVGYRGYYRNAEEHLAPFLRKVRDRIFLISKAPAPIEREPDEEVRVAEARQAAATWSERLDGSLGELGVDRVDAYYLMACHNPSLVESEEIQRAFHDARQAGKVAHLGLSTHRNAQKVLRSAVRSGAYDLAMVAVTPGGWYDWESKGILEGSPPMTGLQPELERARAAGIGLVGMKAARHIAGRWFLPWGNPDAFEEHYADNLRAAPFTPFQRSYAYVLAHGLDVVNADIQSLEQLHENVIATVASPTFFA
jgi:aryl-alcohol dehydrogenase-like predicted oxidoreductase